MASPGGVVKPKKSRGGCSRCKSMRIKCDERKPSCMRCEQKGLSCPGYQLNVRWSRKHEVFTQFGGTCRDKAQPNRAPSSDRTAQLFYPGSDINVNLGSLNEPSISWNDSLWEALQWNSFPPGFALGIDCQASEGIRAEQSTSALQPPCSVGSTFDFFDGVDATSLNILLGSTNAETCSITSAAPEWIDYEARYSAPSHTPSYVVPMPLLMGDLALSRQGFTQPPMFKAMTDTSSALCEYFFKEVIGLYCAWDGPSNYMRATSAEFWQSCEPLYHTMQSMAAVCLVDDFPQLSQRAAKERSKALKALQSQYFDGSGFEGRLIALMLLAQTSSWHAPNDLATEQFRTMQRTLYDWQRKAAARNAKSLEFFTGCMDYWEMILSFVTDSDELTPRRKEVLMAVDPPTAQICQPHEFSGVSSFMVKTLSEVGRLVFRARNKSVAAAIMSEHNARDFLDSLAQARSLEKTLLRYGTRDPGCVVDPCDPMTSVSHFCQIDEAYRCTGLLQLYRIFPDLLRDRYHPWSGHEGLLKPQEALKRPTQDEARRWRTELALHTLNFLKAIPFESRTRCAQPWLMVAVSNELLYASASVEHQLDAFAINIARARRFISSRLHAYSQVLPLRKVKNVVDLVNLIWSEMDSGKLDTYWVDVAYERHLSTMMG